MHKSVCFVSIFTDLIDLLLNYLLHTFSLGSSNISQLHLIEVQVLLLREHPGTFIIVCTSYFRTSSCTGVYTFFSSDALLFAVFTLYIFNSQCILFEKLGCLARAVVIFGLNLAAERPLKHSRSDKRRQNRKSFLPRVCWEQMTRKIKNANKVEIGTRGCFFAACVFLHFCFTTSCVSWKTARGRRCSSDDQVGAAGFPTLKASAGSCVLPQSYMMRDCVNVQTRCPPVNASPRRHNLQLRQTRCQRRRY